jgi:hypothetical protein
MYRALSVACAALVLSGPAPAPQQPAKEYDVVVFGATPAGVIAAVTVAREGKSVVLLEPGKHVGGMISGGLCATDTGNRAAIGGTSREFFDRVRDYYVKKYGEKAPQVRDCTDGFRPEPHVAELIFLEMLRQARVPVVFDSPLPLRSKGRIFVDATYEGDLLAKSAKYAVGREPGEQYGESLAGVQAHSKYHQWPVAVSPFDGGKLLPFVQPGPAGEPGAGDRKVQAYNFRLCLTQNGDRLPFPKPANYDPGKYELLARYLAKRSQTRVGELMHPVNLPNGKTDTNNNGPFSTDHIGASWDYPEGDAKTRQRIWQDHVDYTKGFLYFLAHDPRVPKKLRDDMNTWGLARGEYADNDHWPYQLYIREARRMVGAYVMTQRDLMEDRTKPDSVGLGSYNADSHHVQRVPARDGAVVNEGDFQVPVKPYAIPYRCLVPKKAECTNLLVPVCVSSSHVAYGTIRMEPVFMILGQATGVAAVLAIDNKCAVQDVAVEKLQARLKAQRAVLSPDEIPSAAGPRGINPKTLPGVVVDDTQAVHTGEWVASAATGPFVGQRYLHDGNRERGKMRVRFVPKLPKAGPYEVFLFYSPHPNRARNALVVVHYGDGERHVRVDQRAPWKGDRPPSLGVFDFAAGEAGWVEVRNDDADGYVIADAVQFVPR